MKRELRDLETEHKKASEKYLKSFLIEKGKSTLEEDMKFASRRF